MTAIIALVFGSCSTKKNSWTRRTYHNLTSQYNVYWNGNESIKTGLADFNKTLTTDYTTILRVFNYGTQADAAKLNMPMERAIEKGAITVQKHSMVFGGKELVRWIDDAYLLMGKAHFYKQDYISARRTFEFVSKQYSRNSIAFTADLWLVRSYIQLEQFEKAKALLEALQAKQRNNVMPSEFNKTFSLVYADYFIASRNYQGAIKYLEKSLKEHSNKYLKTRTLFILAQIYQLNGEKTKALNYYNQVLKKNPPYDMAFEARISMARAYDKSQGDSKYILKALNKMLKDEKNHDFRDKIYFALAEIALQEKNDELALEYLRKSVATSTIDKKQQASSSLKAAAMLFERVDYVPAQAYYDTAVSALSRDYPGYDSIRNRASVLNDLVENIMVIKVQDSLLLLARMDSTARIAVIEKIIQKLIEDEKLKSAEEREREENLMMSRQFGNANQNAGQSNEWYFYNPNTLSFGYTEFLRKWGRRKLEDNWRISDKQSISFETIDSKALAGKSNKPGDTTTAPLTDRDRGFYLQNIPLTHEQQQSALLMIEEAFNNLGYIYKERLTDYARAKESYSELVKRFPESDFKLQSWYAMYKMHAEELELTQAEQFKQLILQNYPNTDYARVLIDADYFKRKAALAGESTELFNQTLEAYNNESYFRVLLNANRARTLYPDDVDLLPRFDFLRAVAKGRIEVADSMVVALQQLLKTYPTSTVAPLAASILTSLKKELNLNIDIPSNEADEKKNTEEPSPYNFDAASKHLVMIIVSNENVRADPLKIRLSDFNDKSYTSAQLQIKSLVLDENRTIISVGNFENADGAASYQLAVSVSEYVFGGMSANDFTLLTISLSDYPTFYRLKDVSEYQRFLKLKNQK